MWGMVPPARRHRGNPSDENVMCLYNNKKRNGVWPNRYRPRVSGWISRCCVCSGEKAGNEEEDDEQCFAGSITEIADGHARIHFVGLPKKEDVWMPVDSPKMFMDGGKYMEEKTTTTTTTIATTPESKASTAAATTGLPTSVLSPEKMLSSATTTSVSPTTSASCTATASASSDMTTTISTTSSTTPALVSSVSSRSLI
mmetsp:Transcript_17698/g.30065  ORF Transcript_17698/g.30065 Transcript_17698/m.30065 type:complete len:199 (-) Transcript_17698:979-1575(-)